MKRIALLLISCLMAALGAKAQIRVVDATDGLPVAAASIFNASGNMIGLTWSDGTLIQVPQEAFPLTIRCMGFEPLTIPTSEARDWQLTPASYGLDEVVVTPAKREVMKQTFYVREYFSMYSSQDSISIFTESVADRYLRLSKDVKFRSDMTPRIIASRSYGRYCVEGKDSLMTGGKIFPSMLSLVEMDGKAVKAPKSFSQSGSSQVYEEPGKSGPVLLLKQNGLAFTATEDVLAYKKDHSWTPWPLKLLGLTMEVTQLYTTNVYRTNADGVYHQKDLTECGFVMEANGSGKAIRKMLNEDKKPVHIRTMVEIYVTDREYLTAEQAKEESKTMPEGVQVAAPANVTPVDAATRKLIERVMAKKQ